MRSSTIVMIGFAVLFGLLAVFMAQSWLNSQAEMRMKSLEANKKPIDTETIVDSVKKTNRAVVVEEQWRWFSVASEVAAHLQEHAFDYLDAPVERVSGAEVPAPYARNLEIAAFPSEVDVIDAVHRVLYRRK